MKKAILAKKIGMTQIFLEDGKVLPVTVVEAGPCVVIQKKTVETDGYNAIKVAFGEIRLWQILCFAASFALQRATVGRLLAKGLAVCYNSLSKKLKKDKE